MYRRDDSRLGMAGLGTLMVADVPAVIYAAMSQ